jgi:hypothetical protein
MQNLEKFFVNPFDTSRISDDRMRKFSEDHLQRLAESGLYPALTTAMQAAYGTYFGAITDEATKIAIREGQTKAVDMAMEAIKDAASQQEGAVRAKYGKESPTYQEFYPQGVSEYTKATLANIETILVRFVNAADAHIADLPDLKMQFTALDTQFNNARTAQLASKGEISTSKVQSSEKRDVVEIQLMKDLLTIALDHIGDPPAGLAFFDQSILAINGEDTPPPTP